MTPNSYSCALLLQVLAGASHFLIPSSEDVQAGRNISSRAVGSVCKASFTPQHAFPGACSAPALGWALGTLMSQASSPEAPAQRRQPNWLYPLPSPGLWAGLQDFSLGPGQLWLMLNEAVAWTLDTHPGLHLLCPGPPCPQKPFLHEQSTLASDPARAPR